MRREEDCFPIHKKQRMEQMVIDYDTRSVLRALPSMKEIHMELESKEGEEDRKTREVTSLGHHLHKKHKMVFVASKTSFRTALITIFLRKVFLESNPVRSLR